MTCTCKPEKKFVVIVTEVGASYASAGRRVYEFPDGAWLDTTSDIVARVKITHPRQDGLGTYIETLAVFPLRSAASVSVRADSGPA